MTIDSLNHKIEVNRVSNDNQAIKGYSGAAFKIKFDISKKLIKVMLKVMTTIHMLRELQA